MRKLHVLVPLGGAESSLIERLIEIMDEDRHKIGPWSLELFEILSDVEEEGDQILKSMPGTKDEPFVFPRAPRDPSPPSANQRHHQLEFFLPGAATSTFWKLQTRHGLTQPGLIINSLESFSQYLLVRGNRGKLIRASNHLQIA